MADRFLTYSTIRSVGGLLTFIALILVVGNGRSMAQETIDFRYAPAYTYSAIGSVDDFHKPLVDQTGALLYDFGPGPYVRPGTIIRLTAADTTPVKTSQRYGDARIPVVDSEIELRNGRIEVHTLHVIPASDEESAHQPDSRIRRRNGYTGAVAWCSPPENADASFRNVAWGTNRPITYELAVPENSEWQVVLGLCESYRTRPGLRRLQFLVDGAEPEDVDPLEDAPVPNTPLVYLFDGKDDDGNGVLRVEVLAPTGDPNTHLSGIWLFPKSVEIDSTALVEGRMNDVAEVYVDAGLEPDVKIRPLRQDIISGMYTGQLLPQLEIVTSRRFSFNEEKQWLQDSTGGMRVYFGSPPEFIEPTDSGLKIIWPQGTSEVDVRVWTGFTEPANPDLPSIADALHASERYWLNESNLPYGIIKVPDSELQALLETSVRTMYQSRERVDGHTQFQPGMALYRGMWVHDGVYFVDTALQLGDLDGARAMIDAILSHQKDSGQVEVLRPGTMHRETALLAWVLCRYSEVTGDMTWLQDHWDNLSRAIDWIAELRSRTLRVDAVNYGLIPAGFADGGVGGIQAEYASVNWVLIALEKAIGMARALDRTSDVEKWSRLYESFLTSFRIAAQRDMRRDSSGNVYLPVRVGEDKNSATRPQQGQWTILEALMHGRYISPYDSLAKGTIGMLESHKDQNLITGTGWMEDGIWAYFGAFLAEAYLRMGRGETAADLLYAMANHASPLGTWVEEQQPVNNGSRTAGDYPHAWASSALVRLTMKLLVFPDRNEIRIFRGVPVHWLKADAEIRLDGVPTPAGPLYVHVLVSPDGETADINILPPVGGSSVHQILLDTAVFRNAGFQMENGTSIPSNIAVPGDSPLSLRLVKRGG